MEVPLLKHAKKKQRKDTKRTRVNKRVKSMYKNLLKKAKENPTTETMSAAFKSIDKAAKNHIIHDNKAARLKSSLSKVTVGKVAVAVKKSTKTAQKKKAAKAKSLSNKKVVKKSTL